MHQVTLLLPSSDGFGLPILFSRPFRAVQTVLRLADSNSLAATPPICLNFMQTVSCAIRVRCGTPSLAHRLIVPQIPLPHSTVNSSSFVDPDQGLCHVPSCMMKWYTARDHGVRVRTDPVTRVCRLFTTILQADGIGSRRTTRCIMFKPTGNNVLLNSFTDL
jgi:hypothetical protein